MATLKGQSIAASYQDLVKRADTYSQTGTNIELMDDSGDVQATGLYLESGATTSNVGIGTVPDAGDQLHISASDSNIHVQSTGDNSHSYTNYTGRDSSADKETFVGYSTSTDTLNMVYDSGLNSTSGIAIDSSGSVGIGTANPAAEMELVKDGGPANILVTSYRNDQGQPVYAGRHARGSKASPSIVQDGDTLWQAQGYGYDGDGDFNSFAGGIQIQVDGTPGANDMPGRIKFLTTADGAGSWTERMRIDSSGNVGIGTAAPDTICHIESANPYLTLENSTSEDGDTGRESQVRFQGRQSGGEVSVLAKIQGSHDGSSDDEKGHLLFYTNSGGSEAIRFKIDSNSRISLSNNDGNDYNTVFGYHALTNAGTVLGDVGAHYNTSLGHLAMGTGTKTTATYNTAIGYIALEDVTSGDYNTTVGASSLKSNTDGHRNTAFGYDALGTNVSGDYNTAIGMHSLFSSSTDNNTALGYESGTYTTGADNTYVGYSAGRGSSGAEANNVAVGKDALLAITTGEHNVAIGSGAMDSTTTAGKNVAIGFEAASNLVGGTDGCVAIGYQALDGAVNAAHYTIAIGMSALGALTSGEANIAIGKDAQAAQTDGARNIAIGYEAMDAANSGETENIAIGFNAMKGMDNGGSDRNICIGNYTGDGMGGIAGNDNIFMGYACGSNTWANTTSHTNVAIGNYAMNGAMDACSENTCIGYGAGSVLDNGDSNVMIGVLSGDATTTGYQNVFVGGRTDANIVGGVNQVVIGYNQTGVGNNTAIIGNSSCTDVYMGDDGNAWSQVSDERLKRNIEDWNVGLDAINKLRIRQFQFKDDNPFGFTPDKVRQGVVAQEAIEALPEMIRTNEEGWMSANNESMIWAMVNAIKQLSAKVEELEEKLK